MKDSGIAENKTELRTIIKSRLAALSPEHLIAAGKSAARHFSLIPRLDSFRSVLIFVSMNDELDTRPIMKAAGRAGKAVFVPKVEGNALGFYAVKPAGNALDTSCTEAPPALALQPEHFPALVLSPGLAFDRRLNRLGRGRGYYDRFFDTLDAAGRSYTALGLCMDCQLVEEVPVEVWDKKMDMLLTESALLCG